MGILQLGYWPFLISGLLIVLLAVARLFRTPKYDTDIKRALDDLGRADKNAERKANKAKERAEHRVRRRFPPM